MELEKDYDRNKASRHGTEIGYIVEAMYDFYAPVQIGGQIFDKNWRQVKFTRIETGVGVPIYPKHSIYLESHGLLGYSAAESLRWWLLAITEGEHGTTICLNTRIVSCKINYSQNVEAKEVVGLMSGDKYHKQGGD